MSRAALALDRVVEVLVGLVLAAAGVGAVLWETGVLPGGRGTLRVAGVDRAVASGWWPWALGGAAAVAGLLGLRWLLAHVPHQRARRIRLPGSDAHGRLEVDSGALTAAACAVLETTPGVASTRARTEHRADTLTAVLDVRVRREVDLAALARAADAVSADLRAALGRDDVACRCVVLPARRLPG